MIGGEYQAVIERRPQAQTQLELLLAAADAVAPEFFDRQRVGKINQLRRRFDIFVLAAAGSNEQRRETQGKQ